MSKHLTTILEVKTGTLFNAQESLMESFANSPVLAPKNRLNEMKIDQNNSIGSHAGSSQGSN